MTGRRWHALEIRAMRGNERSLPPGAVLTRTRPVLNDVVNITGNILFLDAAGLQALAGGGNQNFIQESLHVPLFSIRPADARGQSVARRLVKIFLRPVKRDLFFQGDFLPGKIRHQSYKKSNIGDHVFQ